MHAPAPRRAGRTALALRSFALRLALAALILAGIVAARYAFVAPDRMAMLRQTVKILMTTDTNMGAGSGTVVFPGDGYALILSNSHVVRPAPKEGFVVVAYDYDAKGRVRRANFLKGRVVLASDDYDLAVVRVERELPAAVLARELPPIHTPLFAVGAQKNLMPRETKGEVARPDSEWGSQYFESTALVMPGSSGGGYYALLDGEYQLIGVPTIMYLNLTSFRVGRDRRTVSMPISHLGGGITIEIVREFLAELPEFAYLRATPRQ